MNCQRAREHFADLLDPRATSAPAPTPELQAAQAHLAECPDCQREFASLAAVAAELDALPEETPSPRLQQNFYAMLAAEKAAAASAAAGREFAPTPRVADLHAHRLSNAWRWILAPFGACALLAVGFVVGTHYRPAAQPSAPTTAPVVASTDADTRKELQDLRAKVERMESMNQLVAASFTGQQPPANERMHTVLTSATQENPTDRVINELITSLALDPSPNVRLRALDALYAHSNQELVRTAVLMSLSREANPLVQVAMIDFLAAARDHDAKPALEKMAANELVDRDVRQAAQRAAAQL